MPIAIKSFLELVDPFVKEAAPNVKLSVNFIEDRIDYSVGSYSGPFLRRSELDRMWLGADDALTEEMVVSVAIRRARFYQNMHMDEAA